MFGKKMFLLGCRLIPGKGDREELDDEEGRQISRCMRQVIEREMLKERAKL
jgi:hypothetical protein